jgi:hypothetical protein
MSSVVDPQPEQPPAEELVAYLDGELPPDDCRRVEARLAVDAGYRQQLRDLDQAWEALDVLPTRKTNDDFARTTMELVTVAAQTDATAATATVAGTNRRRMTWFIAAGIAGILMGFALAWLLLPSQNRALLRDLPVIRRAETLRQVGNVEFLQRLAAQVPTERLLNDDTALDHEMDQLDAMNSISLDTRRKWVENLSAEEKVVLADQAKRFSLLNPVQQDALRELQGEINSGGENIQRTLLAYEQWLSQLTSWQQEELREEFSERTIAEQVGFVQELVQQERERAFQKLSAEDANQLRKALGKIAADRQAELAATRPRRDGDDRGRDAAMILARALSRNDDESTKVREQLTRDLSPQARRHLETLSGWPRNAQIWRWIRESLRTKVDSDQLERFFVDKLDTRQREELLSLPPKEMQTRLERLYYATELGYGNAAEWMSEFRDSDWPPNRPGPGGRPDGPPRDRERRRPDFRERDGRPRGPDGPPPPRDDGRDGPRPFGPPPEAIRPGDPGDGPPPGGPPPGDGQRPPYDL